ncbi:MAG: EamA family transporter, partial [Tepidiformaceae bacterium]
VTLAVNLARAESAVFTPGPADVAGLLWLGIIQIGFAYVLFGFGIAHIAALEATLIGMLEPVLNPIWVFIFLGETPGWWAALGGLVIIAAVTARTFISERRRPDILATEYHEAAVPT